MTSKRKHPVKARPRKRDWTAWIVGPALGAAAMFVLMLCVYTYGGRPW